MFLQNICFLLQKKRRVNESRRIRAQKNEIIFQFKRGEKSLSKAKDKAYLKLYKKSPMIAEFYGLFGSESKTKEAKKD